MIFKRFIFTCSGPPGGPWDKGPPLTYREKQLSCTPDSQHRDGSTLGLSSGIWPSETNCVTSRPVPPLTELRLCKLRVC